MGRQKTTISHDEKYETLPATFNAIVDYHNALTQTRFTVAGLYVAATGFLINSWFSGLVSQKLYDFIPLIGLITTWVCYILESRTYRLIYDLGVRGLKIERQLHVGLDIGFFALMKRKTPPPKFRQRIQEFVRKRIISYSFALNVIYISFLIFWLYLCLSRLAHYYAWL